jgi:hypothetical protein
MVQMLLAMADAACPVQKDGIPADLYKKLQPGKITGFLCLGDIGSTITHVLRRVCTDIRRVAGPAEDELLLPEQMVRFTPASSLTCSLQRNVHMPLCCLVHACSSILVESIGLSAADI